MSGSDDRTVRLWSMELSTLVLIGRHNDRIVDCRQSMSKAGLPSAHAHAATTITTRRARMSFSVVLGAASGQ